MANNDSDSSSCDSQDEFRQRMIQWSYISKLSRNDLIVRAAPTPANPNPHLFCPLKSCAGRARRPWDYKAILAHATDYSHSSKRSPKVKAQHQALADYLENVYQEE